MEKKSMDESESASYPPIAGESQANFRLMTISLLAAAIGICAGFVAYALYGLIAFFTNLFFYGRISFELVGIEGSHAGLLIILLPVVGGIAVGLMAKYGSSKIRGHGIPEAMEAVLVNRSKIAPRVAILKPISAAIAIGSGGPFGAEGPIIQTGGAIGSLLGQLIHTTASERKVLLACGAAAGMSATFSTPIAAVILAIELLLFEFKSRSFIPLVIASTLATSVHFFLMGRGPMFQVGTVDFGIPSNLPFYLILGVLSGLAAVGLSRALYWIEDMFERLPIDSTWWPAIGGLALGIIGFFFPRVLGVGYETISAILQDHLTVAVLLSVMVFKTLALLLSLGSGTSGGLLAPTFMSSAAMGSLFAVLVNHLFPGVHLAPGACALVAMAAVFGAASRATFTFIIFAFEITRDYDAILPLMLASVIADGIAILLMRNSIMTEKLARRGLVVHQDYEPDALRGTSVAEVMDRDVPTVPGWATVSDAVERIGAGDPAFLRHHAMPVVDEKGELAGIVTRGDLLRELQSGHGTRTLSEIGARQVVVAYPDESVHDAVLRMLRNDVGRLPVVSRDEPRKVIGYLGRARAMQARAKRVEEEFTREAGWLAKIRNGQQTGAPSEGAA
jgi:H+/Cl- antiporter ClcA